jgi:hypothetical protein
VLRAGSFPEWQDEGIAPAAPAPHERDADDCIEEIS